MELRKFIFTFPIFKEKISELTFYKPIGES